MDVTLPTTGPEVGKLREPLPPVLQEALKDWRVRDTSAFGNPYHDEIGKFAPKGAGGAKGGGVFDGSAGATGGGSGGGGALPGATDHNHHTDADINGLAAKAMGGEPVAIDPIDTDDVLRVMADSANPVDLTLVDVQGTVLYNTMRENGIPRSNMPQIDQEYMGAFQQTLSDRGIKFDSESVSPLKLTPTQSELDGRSTGKLVKAMENGEMDWSNAIWVSEEGNILDGHHRWAAAAAIAADGGMNVEIPIIRVHTPIGNLLSVAYEFDEAAAVKTRGFGESWWADDSSGMAASGGTVGESATLRMTKEASMKFAEGTQQPIGMATDAADGITDEAFAGLETHGDGSAFKVPKPKTLDAAPAPEQPGAVVASAWRMK